ncbi:MAG: hypothetical protein Fur0025_21550 [Oscillatoriaceae cyanobacterium]
MLEKILNFITPGPLDERFGFGARVFSSWISLGLGLGLVGLLIGIASGLGATLSLEDVVGSFLFGPILCCGYGLIGVVIDSIRGRRAEYPGWYWWLFPIITFLFILLWATLCFFGIFLAGAGIKLPKFPDFSQPSNIDPVKFRQELEKMKVDDIINNFGKQLDQLDKESKLNPEQKKVFKKIRGLDRTKLRSRLKEIFSDDEREILFLLLLKLLGFIPK